jgi:hypothetical protein
VDHLEPSTVVELEKLEDWRRRHVVSAADANMGRGVCSRRPQREGEAS